MNPTSWLPLAVGGEFTQTRDHILANPCTIVDNLRVAASSTDEIYEATLKTQDVIATGLVETAVRVEVDVSQWTVHGQASLGNKLIII